LQRIWSDCAWLEQIRPRASYGCEVQEIIDMAAIAVVDAQHKK
jgi:hypothetical protein